MKIETPLIITQIKQNLHTCWQKELANVVTDPEILLQMLDIEPKNYQAHFKARKLFPVRVPRPFINRMEKGNINDPLLKQVMPLAEELVEHPGYLLDPLQEHDTVAEGLLHKYKHRVLMIVKSGCAINCRYCFRRHFPYQDNSPNKKRWQSALSYIEGNPDINEVIFSGGDPLMASDEHLAWLIGKIESIQHVKRLRIHTRLPIVIPKRITTDLVSILANTRLKPVLVFHVNHTNEIDDAVAQAIAPLLNLQIPLFNQAVLLKNINDNVDDLVRLSESLFDTGIQPYYLHLFDPVQNVAHFDIEDDKAKTLVKQLMAILPGYLMPKVVREVAGEANKTPLNLA